MAMISKKSRTTGEIPTSSMADIAFLLLIFFLVTTVFDEQKGLPIVLPEAEIQDVSAENVLHLFIRATGTIDVQRGESPNIQSATYREIRGIWRTAVARNDKLIAAVKTEPNTPYVHMINVLDELQVAGAERVSLQILE